METLTDTARLSALLRALDASPFGPSAYFAATKIARQLSTVNPMELPEAVRVALLVFSIHHSAPGKGHMSDLLIPARELIESVRDAL